LFGGQDGLKYIDKFLKQAKKHLNEYGRIYMEFDPPEEKKIEKLLLKYGYKKWWVFKDQYGKARWAVVE
jgi:methylase of polypeptide subunit release factors